MDFESRVGNRRAAYPKCTLDVCRQPSCGCRTTNFRQVMCLRTCLYLPADWFPWNTLFRERTFVTSLTGHLLRSRDGTQSTRTIPIDIGSVGDRAREGTRDSCDESPSTRSWRGPRHLWNRKAANTSQQRNLDLAWRYDRSRARARTRESYLVGKIGLTLSGTDSYTRLKGTPAKPHPAESRLSRFSRRKSPRGEGEEMTRARAYWNYCDQCDPIFITLSPTHLFATPRRGNVWRFAAIGAMCAKSQPPGRRNDACLLDVHYSPYSDIYLAGPHAGPHRSTLVDGRATDNAPLLSDGRN